MAKLCDRIFILFTQEEVDKIKKVCQFHYMTKKQENRRCL